MGVARPTPAVMPPSVAYCRAMDGDDARSLTTVLTGRRLAVTGEVDRGSTHELVRALTGVAEGDLWIDLSSVGHIDEDGLVVLISESRRRATHGAAMFVINPSPSVRRLLDARGLQDFLRVDQSLPPEPEPDRQEPGINAARRNLRSTLRRWTPFRH